MPSLWEILCTLIEFLPQVFILYLILSVVEKSGVLSWFARILHIPVQHLMPVCLSFECTTLGVCAARENPARHRLVYFLSFIPCAAQLPLIVFLLFSILKLPFWTLIALYVICLLVASTIMFMVPKIPNCSVIEPVKINVPNLWHCVLDTCKQTLIFAKKIFIAFVVSAFVIVILARFSFNFQFVNDPKDSILFAICGVLSPIFAPIGLSNPAIICALFFGIIAKESAISVLLFFPNMIQELTMPAILSLVIFYTFYPKCIAAQTALGNTCSKKTATKLFFTNLLVAYGLAFVVYNLCGIFI